MSNFAITKDMTRSERMAAIKEAADRFNAKMQRNFKVRDYSTTPAEDRVDESVNINAWTDGLFLKSYFIDVHFSIAS